MAINFFPYFFILEQCWKFFINLLIDECYMFSYFFFSASIFLALCTHVHLNKFLGWRVCFGVVFFVCTWFGFSNSVNPTLTEVLAYFFNCFPKAVIHAYDLKESPSSTQFPSFPFPISASLEVTTLNSISLFFWYLPPYC